MSQFGSIQDLKNEINDRFKVADPHNQKVSIDILRDQLFNIIDTLENGGYVLRIATRTETGVVKIGAGLSISLDGEVIVDPNLTADYLSAAQIDALCNAKDTALAAGIKGAAPADGDTLEKLNDKISDIQLLLLSNDINLDTVQEIANYIKANKSLIDSVTVNKVNVSDIANNLTTVASGKVLDGRQGKILKDSIDALALSLANYYTEAQTDAKIIEIVEAQTKNYKLAVSNEVTVVTIPDSGANYKIEIWCYDVDPIADNIEASDACLAERINNTSFTLTVPDDATHGTVYYRIHKF
jgi:hypothetical protein